MTFLEQSSATAFFMAGEDIRALNLSTQLPNCEAHGDRKRENKFQKFIGNHMHIPPVSNFMMEPTKLLLVSRSFESTTKIAKLI
jgi:hypothetical protein